MTGPDDQGNDVGAELERVARRWQQLPLDRALPAVPDVLALLQRLADEVAQAQAVRLPPVPDLGPAVLVDQLRVLVYDYREARLDEQVLGERLSTLRRTLP